MRGTVWIAVGLLAACVVVADTWIVDGVGHSAGIDRETVWVIGRWEGGDDTGPRSATLGRYCRAPGANSFAGGHGAVASNDESFVWAATSLTRTNYYDHGDGTFSIYAPGGVWIGHSKLYIDPNGFVRALPPNTIEPTWYTLGGDSYGIDPGVIPTWPDMGDDAGYWDNECRYTSINPCDLYWGDSADRQNQACSY